MDMDILEETVKTHTEAMLQLTRVFNSTIDDQNKINEAISTWIIRLMIVCGIQSIFLIGILITLAR